MNRAQIRELVLENTRRTDKTGLMNLAINAALQKVSSDHLWIDLMVSADLAIVANDASVAIPSNCHRLADARLIVAGSPSMSRGIKVRPRTWVNQWYPSPSDQPTGKPVYAYLEGSSLYFVPLSDGSYTVRVAYYRLHPDLTADTDECLIRHAGQCVAAYATHWVFKAIEQHENAAQWAGLYVDLFRSAKKVDKDNAATKFYGIPRGEEPPSNANWQDDPFVKTMP